MTRPNYLRLDYPDISRETRDKLTKYNFDMKEVYLGLYRLCVDSELDDDFYDIFERKAKEFNLEPNTHDYRDVLFLARDLCLEVMGMMRMTLRMHLERVDLIEDVILEPACLYLVIPK